MNVLSVFFKALIITDKTRCAGLSRRDKYARESFGDTSTDCILGRFKSLRLLGTDSQLSRRSESSSAMLSHSILQYSILLIAFIFCKFLQEWVEFFFFFEK